MFTKRSDLEFINFMSYKRHLEKFFILTKVTYLRDFVQQLDVTS